ncbi:hypothetical protein PV08_09098 [Exophiala spinifera]|uniref:Pre-mRNA polyadenylation factor Fip1 domain-containing protein n=1 Tax=Exophiala spinifera TaxID=91928 RepID=A0A0D2AZD3_9EURO|nr:uncharacterized protein PV08_09098 [Exophiala spinifera]KIW11825.1 hypothetical protein PV08_09098 [Exophiala spinifera]
MMDSDEDDIYPEHNDTNGAQHHAEVKMEDVEDGEEEGEEVEDSDDDVDFIIDAKEEVKPDPGASQSKRVVPGLTPVPTSADPRKASSSSTPQPIINKPGTPATGTDSQQQQQQQQQHHHQRLGSTSQPPNDRPGTDYPARHTSKLDPNGNPVHPATGKPILATDFDLDFPSESSKPWRKPGADITDYFNYGFDEFTWASYCLKQQTMPKEIKEINQQAEQMKAFVEGIPGGGAGGIPGMPPLPGGASGPASGGGVVGLGGGAPDMSAMAMPSEAQMQQMFAAMTSQGLDPTTMDPNQFMQFMAAGGAGAGGGGMMVGQGGPPTGPGGFGGGGFDQGGGGGFGRGRGKGGRRNW